MTTSKYIAVVMAFKKLFDYEPTPQTWARWIAEGKDGVKLEAYKLGGKWVTTVEAVEVFVKDSSKASSEKHAASLSSYRAKIEKQALKRKYAKNKQDRDQLQGEAK